MEKKIFEAPEMSVTVFDEADILTFSPTQGSGEEESTDINQW